MPAGSPVQYQVSQTSSVYAVSVVGGRLFSKQCRPNSGESQRTLVFSKIFTKYTDNIVKIDTKLETILMHENGPSGPTAINPEDGLKQCAMIQQECIHRMDELKAG